MLTRFSRTWLRLWHTRPGRRFQNYYRRTHRQKNSDEMVPRVGRLILAVIFFIVAVCLLLFPLIYIPFFVLSAAMVASESSRFARILDHGEEWTRDSWARTRQRYGLSGRTVNIAKWTLGLGCLVLTGCLYYNRFMR
jgi:uncharacterized membrane protein